MKLERRFGRHDRLFVERDAFAWVVRPALGALFLCLGREGESDFEVDLDETKYEFVKGVRGIKTVWGLFRRK